MPSAVVIDSDRLITTSLRPFPERMTVPAISTGNSSVMVIESTIVPADVVVEWFDIGIQRDVFSLSNPFESENEAMVDFSLGNK